MSKIVDFKDTKVGDTFRTLNSYGEKSESVSLRIKETTLDSGAIINVYREHGETGSFSFIRDLHKVELYDT